MEGFDVPYDIIIASECIYYEELVDPLLSSIKALSGPGTQIFASFEEHRPESVKLFSEGALKQGFQLESVPTEHLHPVYRSNKISVVKLQLTKV